MKTLLVFVSYLLFASSAFAFSITNMDDEPHQVVIEETSGSKIVRLVNPGEVIHTLSHGGEVYVKGTEHRVRPYGLDELVIWGDGNIMIQKRRQLNGGVF